MHKAALYAGSFDPFTHGHLDVVKRASQAYHRVIIGIAVNPKKTHLFTVEERIRIIKSATEHLPNVTIMEIPAGRFTVDIAYEQNCVLLRGVRMNSDDFNMEWLLSYINQAHQQGVDTHVLPALPQFNNVSSSGAKDVCKLNGNTEDFVSLPVKQLMEERLMNQRRIGLTGTIGSGKSTITKALVQKLQEQGKLAHDLDIDAIAGDIMFKRSEPAYVQLREDLMDMLEIPSWTKFHVGNAIFNNESKRIALNQRLKQPLITRIRAELQGKEGYIFVNCALLAEAGMLPFVNNNVIVLDVEKDEQRKRLKARGYDDDQIARRVASQYTTDEKLRVIGDAHAKTVHGVRKVIRTDARKTVDTCVYEIITNFLPYTGAII